MNLPSSDDPNDCELAAAREPPRIAKLRQLLVERIPCPASDRQELLDAPLRALMVHYLNYVRRFVPPRARSVTYSDAFWTPRALKFLPEIFAIEREILSGADLTARLSKKVFTEGYVGARAAFRKRPMKWDAKDFALNVLGVHHLHIGRRDSSNGIEKGNELLFAQFWRNAAEFVLLGDHRSFDDGSLTESVARWQSQSGRDVKGVLRLQRSETDFQEITQLARRGLSSFAQFGDKIVLGTSVATSGHSVETSISSGRLIKALADIEPKLDDMDYVKSVFCNVADKLPQVPDLEWTFDCCDLWLIEKTTRAVWRVVNVGC